MFTIQIPSTDAQQAPIHLANGDVLFLLGANGTGKSALIQSLYNTHHAMAIRIAAHRRTWLTSSVPDINPRSKQQQESNIRNNDLSPQSRWLDNYDAARPTLALYRLIEAENTLARDALAALRDGNDNVAHQLARQDGPIRSLNRVLRLANFAVSISIEAGDNVQTRRTSGISYSMAQMSDGERSAALLAAEVLTARSGSLVLIDEPERHLHRSIIGPLLGSLFESRSDCVFIIATHEVAFPTDFPEARTVLLRGCEFGGDQAAYWDYDILDANRVDDGIKRDILGARRRVLFIEGTDTSLDKKLYSILFPDVSVISKGNCHDVERVVRGLRGSEELNWLEPFGIVDGDDRSQEELIRLEQGYIYALPFYSVESILYHPYLQNKATERLCAATGEEVAPRLAKARMEAMEMIKGHIGHLVSKATARAVHERYLQQEPNRRTLDANGLLTVTIDVDGERARQRERLRHYIEGDDLEEILARCPVRETGALRRIGASLGFANRGQYEQTVLRVLSDDADMRAWARSLFGSLPTILGV